jgi:F-type H+-transporting ATPase subunit delta
VKGAGMSKGAELAREYAQAAYQHTTEGWLGSLKKVWSRLQAAPGLLDELTDPSLAFAARQSRLDAIVPEDVPPDVRNYIYLMLRDDHIEMLGDVVTEMTRLAVKGPDVKVARVTTAVALTGEEREEFQTRIRARYGDQMDIDFLVDAKILGGAVVRIGDRVIDGSLSNRLEALHSRLRSIR